MTVEGIHRPEGDTNTAKQAAILLADIEHAGRWVETVWALFDRQLPYPEFVAAYMDALQAWEHGRKLAQHQMHWRYGPSRRSQHLIDRDTRKTSATMERELERNLSRLLERHPEMATRHPGLVARLEDLRSTLEDIGAHPAPQPATRRAMRDLSSIPPTVIETITVASGMTDLTHATDKTIFDNMIRRGTPEHAAIAHIKALKGLRG